VGTAEHHHPNIAAGRIVGGAPAKPVSGLFPAGRPGSTVAWRRALCLPDPDLERRLLALQDRIGTCLVACDRTAAQLHGFGVLPDGALHVMAAPGRPLRDVLGVRIHQGVPRLPTKRLGRVVVTDPAETAIEVARAAADVDVLAVLDAARHSGVTPDSLSGAVTLARGSRGITGVRQWLERADPRAESAMESRTRWRILDAGLPAPDLQVLVAIGPGVFRRVDLGWRRRRVALEYDGAGFCAPAGSMARDRVRHRQLLHAGWTMLYATESDIRRDPAPLLARLRPLLS
jgi:very-short-patch-repair endonuclease